MLFSISHHVHIVNYVFCLLSVFSVTSTILLINKNVFFCSVMARYYFRPPHLPWIDDWHLVIFPWFWTSSDSISLLNWKDYLSVDGFGLKHPVVNKSWWKELQQQFRPQYHGEVPSTVTCHHACSKEILISYDNHDIFCYDHYWKDIVGPQCWWLAISNTIKVTQVNVFKFKFPSTVTCHHACMKQSAVILL